MGKMILVEGAPGTGKSRAILNLNPETTLIIKPNNKDLPFPGSRVKYVDGVNVVKTTDFADVRSTLEAVNKGTHFKTVIIEDITHLFSKRVMHDASDTGYAKWTNLAIDAFSALVDMEEQFREDLTVIIIGHTQVDKDQNGFNTYVLQTPGKLLENVIKIPSYFTYVLHTDVEEGLDGIPTYYFLTNRDGSGKEAKSPEGCLNLREPNDYALIIEKIDAYHNKA
jgi:hypothetical protein